MGERDQEGPIERLRGLGEAIDRAISESRLKRAQYQGQQGADEVRALRRLLEEQTRRHPHDK